MTYIANFQELVVVLEAINSQLEEQNKLLKVLVDLQINGDD